MTKIVITMLFTGVIVVLALSSCRTRREVRNVPPESYYCLRLCCSAACIDSALISAAVQQDSVPTIDVFPNSDFPMPWSQQGIKIPDEATDNFSILFVSRHTSELVGSIEQTCTLARPVHISVSVLDRVLARGDYRLLVFHNRVLIGETDYVYTR